jgi:hypothetical protein
MSGAQLTVKLPPALIGRAHLAQLVRELEDVENNLERQKAKGEKLSVPTLSQALADCVEMNKVELLVGTDRRDFKSALRTMKDKAPTMHFTFATQPDGESLQQLVEWVRQNIHPQALVSVGLQPALVGGVFVRTPNHVHDFSLRAKLHDSRGLIAEKLEELRAA